MVFFILPMGFFMKKGNVRFRGFTGLVLLILLFNYACQGPLVESADGNVRMVGNKSADRLGRSVVAVGHVNWNSQGEFTDILVGAPSFDDEVEFNDRGAAYLIFGNRFPPALVTPSSQNPEGPLPDITFVGDEPRGNLGFSGAGVGDVNGDGFDDFLIGAPLVGKPNLDGSFLKNNGAAYLVFGGDKLQDKVEACELTFRCACIEGSADLDFKCANKTDPRMRVLISESGKKHYTVVMSRSALEESMIIVDPNDSSKDIPNPIYKLAFILQNGDSQSNFGFSLAGVGDVNGDGCPDFLIGAPFLAIQSGAAYLYMGSGPCNGGSDLLSTDPTPKISPIDPEATFIGDKDNLHLGISVSGLGDVNGDKFADLLIGAPGEVPGTAFTNDINISIQGCTGIGHAFIFLGRTTFPPPPFNTSGNADVNIEGPVKTDGFGVPILSNNNCFGISVSGLGDTNGDNLPDFIIGAPLADIGNPDPVNNPRGPNEGSAYIFFGNSGWKPIDPSIEISLNLMGADANRIIEGNQENEFLGGALAGSSMYWTGLPGSSVPGLWDINGDDLSDFAIGATNASSAGGDQNGAVYLFLGSMTPSSIIKSSEAQRVFSGARRNDLFGTSIGMAGDFNNDQSLDLLIGSPLNDNNNFHENGLVLLQLF